MKYKIEFYEKSNGTSDVWDFLEELREQSFNSKDARIQYNQLSLYINLLEKNGTNMNENFTKHIEDGIWELRPGHNRVFYFCFDKTTIVLLHCFRKKTQKTPKKEIEKAKSERNDYFERKGK
ncbi:MAG: type II toxin-antitoxin system RelE/ParE family toxin [Acidaminococcaceae bacterium]|nr:type II toxin-antitoxin system RelE/ParE family toxin [Acidaminococcaceae bacterium]